MVEVKYANAYKEILEILKYITIEEYKKIPKNKIDFFETNANDKYVFNYDSNKTLKEQNVSDIAKCIIILLFRDYWATDKQREKIIAKQKYDRQILEKQKCEKYNPNEIFQKRSNYLKESSVNSLKNNTQIIEYKEPKWYKKIIEKILRVLGIK